MFVRQIILTYIRMHLRFLLNLISAMNKLKWIAITITCFFRLSDTSLHWKLCLVTLRVGEIVWSEISNGSCTEVDKGQREKCLTIRSSMREMAIRFRIYPLLKHNPCIGLAWTFFDCICPMLGASQSEMLLNRYCMISQTLLSVSWGYQFVL